MEQSLFESAQNIQPPTIDPNYINPDYLSGKFWTVWNFLFHNPTLENIIGIILAIFSFFFITLICYSAVRMLEIRKREDEHLQHEIHEYAHYLAEKEKAKQSAVPMGPGGARWKTVVEYVLSGNPADWRLAILECDSMLEDLVEQLGYKGDTLGEKLKTVNRDTFHSLDYAWEAHIFRNRIAHEGLQFEISNHEAKRVAALYEQVFREFDYI